MTPLTLLYRGPLASCNYACAYCPFAKKKDSRRDLANDARALARFVRWAAASAAPLRVFFTPWGEALVRRHYQRALADLAAMPHVGRIAIQTNLSFDLGFLDRCAVEKLGLWCTFHPTEVPLARFAARCRELSSRAVPYSVGIVGKPEHVELATALRRALPGEVYVWVNADRRASYDAPSLAALMAVDPLFAFNHRPAPSLGAPCAAGHEVVAVDGDGDVRRCHFLPDVIGNLYEAGWERALVARPCTRESCTCHIGYVHRRDLPLSELFGGGILERRLPMADPAARAGSAPWQRLAAAPR